MKNSELGSRLMFLNLLRRSRLHRLACDCTLHNGQMPILETLLHNPGCTQKELSELLHVTPASIALSTKRLQKGGLIEKRIDESNRRCNRLFATETGAALSAQFREYFDAVDSETFAHLTEAERETLCALLDRMIDSLNTEHLTRTTH